MLPYTTKVFTLALCASVSVCRSHILLLSIYRIWAPQKLSIVEHGLVPVDNVEPLLLWMPDWQFAERVARPNRDWPLGAVVEECIPGRCVEWVSSVSADECCFRNRTGTNDIVPATLNHESTRATWISLMDEEALDAGVSTLDLRFPGGGRSPSPAEHHRACFLSGTSMCERSPQRIPCGCRAADTHIIF
jgi:hypothetical protein